MRGRWSGIALPLPLARRWIVIFFVVIGAVLAPGLVDALATPTSGASAQSSFFPSDKKSFKTQQLLILGLGRVGLECALLAAATDSDCHFKKVVGTVRSWPPKSQCDDGIERIPFEDLEAHIQNSSHVLWTIPLPKEQDETLEGALHSLQSNSDHFAWIGMVSTTGIYGNHDGKWVTEDSPLLCTPESNADLYRQVETKFEAMGGQIFRCAGIYDSTRSALHTVYQKGIRPSERANDDEASITNRIHSHDIARAILSSLKLVAKPATRRISRIYNLADDEPAPRSVVLEYAANLLESIGVKLVVPSADNPIAETDRPLTKRERRRATDRKLVSNDRMKQELLDTSGLAYPTYREGLKAILDDPSTPWYNNNKKDRK